MTDSLACQFQTRTQLFLQSCFGFQCNLKRFFLYPHLSSVGGPTIFVFDISPTLRPLMQLNQKKTLAICEKSISLVCVIRNLILGSSKLLGPKKGFLLLFLVAYFPKPSNSSYIFVFECSVLYHMPDSFFPPPLINIMRIRGFQESV